MDTTAVSPPTQTRSNLIGIGWMLLTGLFFVAVNGTVRWVGDDLPAAQSGFLRFVFGTLFLALPLTRALQTGFPAPVWRKFILRGTIHVCAVVLWFFAMARIPVAEVTAIGFINPIVVTVGAALLMGEVLGWRRMLAIAIALAGALIVLRPGVRVVEMGHVAQLGASICFGASYLITKQLTRVVPAATVVAMMSMTVTVGLAPLAAVSWVSPTGPQLAALALAALFGTAAHYCMSRAFQAAPMTVTQPVVFLQLVWASLLGALVFGERVDVWVIVGGAVMIGAISWITWREAQLARR